MTRHWQASDRSRQFAVLAAVATIHLALLTLWHPWGVSPRPGREARPRSEPLSVRLLPWGADDVPAQRLPPVLDGREPSRPGRHERPVEAAPSAPSLVTGPTAATDDPAGSMPTVRPLSVAPLNLDLPRAWRRPASAPGMADMADNARRDPRSNDIRRPTLERAMAATLSDLRTTETLADGTQRIREGARCTLVHPSRASAIDAFDTVHDRAGGSEPCP